MSSRTLMKRDTVRSSRPAKRRRVKEIPVACHRPGTSKAVQKFNVELVSDDMAWRGKCELKLLTGRKNHSRRQSGFEALHMSRLGASAVQSRVGAW